MTLQQNDNPDIISCDIPFLIRILEHIRENVKSDADLHKFVEILIQNKDNVLTMNEYDTIFDQYEKTISESTLISHIKYMAGLL